MRLSFLLPLLAVLVGAPALAGPTDTVLATLRREYPATHIDSVTETPVPGLFAVRMGENLAYVTPNGKYWIFGALYDMPAQLDLTAAALRGDKPVTAAATSAPAGRQPFDFSTLPLADAIVRVKGDGRRRLVLFSDTECGYCRKLEPELAKLDNVTIYTFPIAILGSPANAQAIWCSADRGAAWEAFFGRGKTSPPGSCATPLERNLTLATRLGVRGTPMMFAERGALAGAQSAEAIRAWLELQ